MTCDKYTVLNLKLLPTRGWAWVACFVWSTVSVAWHLATIPSIRVQKAE